MKLLIYFFLPIIFSFFAALFWCIFCLIFRKWREFKSKFIGTIVIIFFLLHPSVSKIILQTYNCIEIEGKSRLRSDLSQECYKGQHKIMAFVISLTGTFIWVLGIPITAGVMLYKSKSTIYNVGLL